MLNDLDELMISLTDDIYEIIEEHTDSLLATDPDIQKTIDGLVELVIDKASSQTNNDEYNDFEDMEDFIED